MRDSSRDETLPVGFSDPKSAERSNTPTSIKIFLEINVSIQMRPIRRPVQTRYTTNGVSLVEGFTKKNYLLIDTTIFKE